MISSALKFIFSLRAMTTRLPVEAACLLLPCVLTYASILSRASAQAGRREGGNPVVTFRETMVLWGEGPGYYYARSEVVGSDGSHLLDFEYSYKSGKRFKSELKDCAKDAFRVVDDSKLLDVKERTIGQRVLIIT